MIRHRLRRPLVATLALLLALAASAAAYDWTGHRLSELLEALRNSGFEVAYSTELVPPTLRMATAPGGQSLLQQTAGALASAGLHLRMVAPNRYVVDRISGQERPADVLPAGDSGSHANVAPLDEVLVFASRDAAGIDALTVDSRRLRHMPGAQEDAFVALRSLPGIAADTSARPYVRGSSQEDVLVIFDHVPVPDPFHLNGFGNLYSVFDVSTIDRINLYSGGFPVRYGTRSGGVVDLLPHAADTGHELTLGAGLSALRVTSTGRSDDSTVEWLAAARHSLSGAATLAAGDHLTQPVTLDAIARLRWNSSEVRSWTFGLLVLDDSLRTESRSAFERANAASRNENYWLTTESHPADGWQTRTTLVGTHTRSRRDGDTSYPGLMSGTLDDQRDLSGVSAYYEANMTGSGGAIWDLGGELALTSGSASYLRTLQYDPIAAQTIGADLLGSAAVAASLRSTSGAAYASYARPLGRHVDAELGLRVDGQKYPGLNSFEEWSPRLNLRYRASPGLLLHLSSGKYTQAQRPEERRFEESQYLPDHPQVQWQDSIGADYRHNQGPLWRLDLYHKHWDRVSPYFDNLLSGNGLLPELSPLRVRIAPTTALSEGAELSVRSAPENRLQYWTSYSWAMVQDRVGRNVVSRSWDERSALSSGIDVTRGAFSGTAALRWHSGNPQTSVRLINVGDGADPQLVIGPRNAGQAPDYVSLDLRAAWTTRLTSGDLEWWSEVTNAFNRAGSCCAATGIGGAGGTGRAAPRTVNLGVLWKIR
jgi:hypothetical protein